MRITKTIMFQILMRYASRLARHSRFGVGGFTRYVFLLAVLLSAYSAWAGELWVDNITVASNAAIYGNLNICSGLEITGGTITTNGNYRIHSFTNSGTFAVSSGSATCDVLVVAGGGGAGYDYNYHGAGGGGGGLLTSNAYVLSGAIAVTVGAGGAAGTSTTDQGKNGSNSVFGTMAAIGGGGGGSRNYGYKFGKDGGSGGGAAGDPHYDVDPTYTKGYGIVGPPRQGYDGGTSMLSVAYGSGGGGAGGNGQNNISGGQASGGLGVTNDISGSAVVYAAGGYGGGSSSAGTANRGNGGNGGNGSNGHGGSGIVIVRYLIPASSNTTIMTISSNGINQVGTSASNIFMGKVGIGTDNPAEKLHVAGDMQVDGTNIVSAIKLGGDTRTTWPTGNLSASNNLSDLTNAASARANLGLGSAATNDASAFLAPNGNGAQLTNITAAQVGALSTNAGALIAANNLSDVNNIGTTRSNLGLGSAATNETSAFDPAGMASAVSNVLSAHTVASNNPHLVTAAQVGALSTNGGTMNGELTILNPGGDIPMGSYTNQ